MFTGKQFGVLGLVTGANLLLSLLVSTVGGSLGAQGPTGQTGPQGPQGSTGETGANGREVEFQVDDNVLQWRYIGDTEWQILDLEISGGGGSTINTGGGSNLYSNWVFNTEPTLRFDYRSRISVDNAATYAANLIANEGYVGVSSIADLQAIDDSPESLAGKYVLTSNIDLTTFTPDIINNNYNVVTNTFSGIFDGATYTISNYNINTTDNGGNSITNAGIFNELRGATVQNLTLNNFTYTTPGSLEYSGALAGSTSENDNNQVMIDQVFAENLTFKATNQIYETGGLIGEVDSDLEIIRTQVSSTQFQSDSQIYGSGGVYGWVDGSYNIEIYEVSSALSIGGISDGVNPDVDRVGGTAGNHQSYGSILAYRVTSSLSGKIDSHSAGFIGNVEGVNKVILQDVTVQAELTQLSFYNGYNNGGVFGFFGRDGLLIMDDIQVNGTIEGDHDIGGFIGYAEEGSTIRIANSVNNANLNGDESIGGMIGRLAGNSHKWLFDNVEVNSTITLKEIIGDAGQYGSNYGGLIGYVEERDDDVEFTSQIMIKDTDVNVTFEANMGTIENVESRYYELDSLGGMVGYVSYDNDIRISNSSVTMEVNFIESLSSKLEGLNVNFDQIGALMGYSEDSSILALNVTTQVEVNTQASDFTPEAGSFPSAYFSMTDVGGLIGELDSGQLTVVAGQSNLSIDLSVENLNSTIHDYEFTIDSTGGLVGYMDDESFLIVEELAVSYDVTLSIVDVPVGDGNTMYVYIRDNGTFIGDASGLAFLTGLTSNTTITQVLPEEDNLKIFLEISAMNNPIGTNNPFVFIQE